MWLNTLDLTIWLSTFNLFIWLNTLNLTSLLPQVYPVTPASRGPRGTPGERAYPAPLEIEAPPVVSTRMSCLEGTGAKPGHGGRGEKMALEEDLAREDSRLGVRGW